MPSLAVAENLVMNKKIKYKQLIKKERILICRTYIILIYRNKYTLLLPKFSGYILY